MSYFTLKVSPVVKDKMSGRDFAHLQQDNAEVERAVLSQEVESLRTRIGLRQVDVSKECGVNASMLSQWMLGRYKGNVARINGLMESWLIRRRGGKPLDKPIVASPVGGGQGAGVGGASPKFKRKLDEGQDGQMFTRRKASVVFAQRKLYSYPKEPAVSNYLIPIRLDVDIEGYRYIDSFSWNLYEKDYTFETFAAALVRDLDLPDCFYKKIAASIQTQVELARRSLPWDEAVREESIHPICINIRLNDTILIDRFEWDLHDSRNDPEQFARTLCQEVGLRGEFEAQVALAIREQLRDYSRLMREGLGDRVSKMPTVTIALRDPLDAPAWEPYVKYILAEDIPQLEREDFKRRRPMTQSTAVAQAGPTTPVVKPNRPPKPVNTFLMFCREWRRKIMTENTNINAKDASRILGEMWQKLSEEERASYQIIADKENEKRLREWRLKEKLPVKGVTNGADDVKTENSEKKGNEDKGEEEAAEDGEDADEVEDDEEMEDDGEEEVEEEEEEDVEEGDEEDEDHGEEVDE